ncbi:ribosome-binding protein 1 isoform X2 [Culicoides brevitarsis]|uniref:ribosome-binding protein 1 isoform X2 n=1 Tax=Culicoides brevitarsis TaxID=469753 RepID=UPI00307C13ED
MLDLQVYGVILIVVLFSLGSILLISKLPRGKTFDEMLEEQRQFKAQLLAASSQSEKAASGNKKDNNKNNNNKKGKNQQKKGGGKKSPAVVNKPKQETEESAAEVESDTDSDRSGPETSPIHTNKSKRDVNVDFIETEAFPLADHIPAKNANKGKKNKKGGILVNKSEHPLVSSEMVAEEANHFVELHPRDAVEIHRLQSLEEANEATLHKNTRNFKDKKGRKYTPPISPVNQIKDNKLAEEAESTAIAEQPAPVKEKHSKKKKAESVAAAVHVPSKDTSDFHHQQFDEDTVRTVLKTLRSAELTRNEIQILIDFLLNKQHDTTAKDPTEWTEGKSDVMQKLKKQLQEKEKQLLDEQEASNAFQAKLRELRSEINAEKSNFNATIKHHIEELNNKKKELQNISSELHYSKEKHNAEKVALSQQLQQLQSKFMQMKGETGASQEAIQKYQQLAVQHEQLKQELIDRNTVLAELQRRENEQRQFVDGLQKTLADREQKIGEFDRVCKQKDEQLKFLDSKSHQEQQVLRAELEKQRLALEQLKHQLAEAQSKTANLNHLDDASKVEMKNLQNALDSSRKELNSYKTQYQEATQELNDLKQKSDKTSSETVVQITEMKTIIGNLKTNLIEKENKLDEYETLIKRLKHEEDVLRSELDEQKTKNNDSATRAAETNIEQIIADEQNRTKETLVKLIPELPSNGPTEFNKWLEFTTSFLKKKLAASTQNSSSNSSKVNNSHMNGNESISSSTFSSDTNNCSEALLLQNAQLQKSLDDYKNIVADTEKVLRNLEAKVTERDSYWQAVVQSKEDEILILKNTAQS